MPPDRRKELQKLFRQATPRRHEPRGLSDPPSPPLLRAKPTPPNPFRDPFRPGQRRPTPPGARAKRIRAEPYPLEFGPIDVLDIRARFHATPEEFARMIGISVDTLRNWEQGKRRPQGPARALLRVAAANPNVVAATLLRFRRAWWMSW